MKNRKANPRLKEATHMNVHKKIQNIVDELNTVHQERLEIIDAAMVALIAKQHLLLLGKPGSGKSFLVRDLLARITPRSYFERALYEGSDPSEVVGPVDIKGMVEEGVYRRITTGKLPEARFAFLDEAMNANVPVLHVLMPMLNERIFHNDGVTGEPTDIDLWSTIMATNKLVTDAEVHAFWDRTHLRVDVPYVRERDNLKEVVFGALDRSRTDYVKPEPTTITFDELKQAHDESVALGKHFPEPVWTLFCDLRDLLAAEQVTEISTRRIAEGMTAICANAWYRGHDEVRTGDLDILRHMWWTTLQEREAVEAVIGDATNPTEKDARELFKTLEKIKGDLDRVKDLDESKQQREGMRVIKDVKRITARGNDLRDIALAAGSSTTRVDNLLRESAAVLDKVSEDVFGLSAADTRRVKNS